MEEKQKPDWKAAWADRELAAIRAELIRRERMAHKEAVQRCIQWFAAQRRAKEAGHGRMS